MVKSSLSWSDAGEASLGSSELHGFRMVRDVRDAVHTVSAPCGLRSSLRHMRSVPVQQLALGSWWHRHAATDLNARVDMILAS